MLYATESGSVWSFGSNQEGQLGLGGTNAECTPRKLEGLSGGFLVVRPSISSFV